MSVIKTRRRKNTRTRMSAFRLLLKSEPVDVRRAGVVEFGGTVKDKSDLGADPAAFAGLEWFSDIRKCLAVQAVAKGTGRSGFDGYAQVKFF